MPNKRAPFVLRDPSTFTPAEMREIEKAKETDLTDQCRQMLQAIVEPTKQDLQTILKPIDLRTILPEPPYMREVAHLKSGQSATISIGAVPRDTKVVMLFYND